MPGRLPWQPGRCRCSRKCSASAQSHVQYTVTPLRIRRYHFIRLRRVSVYTSKSLPGSASQNVDSISSAERMRYDSLARNPGGTFSMRTEENSSDFPSALTESKVYSWTKPSLWNCLHTIFFWRVS